MKKPPKTVVKPARLTNDMRTSFVAAVMADVPKTDFESKIRDAVNKAHAAALPAVNKAHAAGLPAVIKKLLADPEMAGYVNIESDTIRSQEGLPQGKCMTFRLAAPSHKYLEELIMSAADPLIKEWVAQDETRRQLQTKLYTVAAHCTTTTKLAEAFPEFSRYLPQTEAEGTRNLPALTNIVTDFVKAGWPKGQNGGAK